MDWPAILTAFAAIIAALTGLVTSVGVILVKMKQNTTADTINKNAVASSQQKEEIKNTILQKVEDVKQQVATKVEDVKQQMLSSGT